MALGDITYLQNQITSTNKLSADLLDTSTSTGKTVTEAEKTTWNEKSNKTQVLTGTLLAANWSNKTQTLSISGLETSGYTYTVAPSSADFTKWADAMIYANDITTANSITFNCNETPTNNIGVTILKIQST